MYTNLYLQEILAIDLSEKKLQCMNKSGINIERLPKMIRNKSTGKMSTHFKSWKVEGLTEIRRKLKYNSPFDRGGYQKSINMIQFEDPLKCLGIGGTCYFWRPRCVVEQKTGG